jgi:undecaprenol kinase
MDLSDNKKRPPKNKTFIDSFRYAFEGVRTVFQEERNMRSHMFSFVAVILLSLFLPLSLHEWLWILLVSFLMIIMEILNTVIENIIDFISPDYHPLAKKVKDMAAAAVLFTSFFALVTGAVILLPKIFAILKIYQ